MIPPKPKDQCAFEKEIASLASEFNQLVAQRTTPEATRVALKKRRPELKGKAGM